MARDLALVSSLARGRRFFIDPAGVSGLTKYLDITVPVSAECLVLDSELVGVPWVEEVAPVGVTRLEFAPVGKTWSGVALGEKIRCGGVTTGEIPSGVAPAGESIAPVAVASVAVALD